MGCYAYTGIYFVYSKWTIWSLSIIETEHYHIIFSKPISVLQVLKICYTYPNLLENILNIMNEAKVHRQASLQMKKKIGGGETYAEQMAKMLKKKRSSYMKRKAKI